VATFTVVFDACVLYPAPLRDLLMWLSITDLFRARWTDQILKEWVDNLLEKRADLRREQLERTCQLMNACTMDCLITGYENLIEGLQLPDPKDRHVLAAAIRGYASIIVTFNLDDFPAQYLRQFGLEIQHPDDFIMHLIDLAPGVVCAAAKNQRSCLRKPSKTVQEYLDTLARQQLPGTVRALREYAELL